MTKLSTFICTSDILDWNHESYLVYMVTSCRQNSLELLWDDNKHKNDATETNTMLKHQTTTHAWGDSSTPAPPGRHRSAPTASITQDTTRKRMERWRNGWMERWMGGWMKDSRPDELVRSPSSREWGQFINQSNVTETQRDDGRNQICGLIIFSFFFYNF